MRYASTALLIKRKDLVNVSNKNWCIGDWDVLFQLFELKVNEGDPSSRFFFKISTLTSNQRRLNKLSQGVWCFAWVGKIAALSSITLTVLTPSQFGAVLLITSFIDDHGSSAPTELLSRIRLRSGHENALLIYFYLIWLSSAHQN